MRDLTDCRLVEDEHRNLYSVIVGVKGFGRSEVTLHLEEDGEMAKKIVGRISEIVQQYKTDLQFLIDLFDIVKYLVTSSLCL